MENTRKGPRNSLEGLSSLPEKNPLRILWNLLQKFPIEGFNFRNRASHPQLPEREWTAEELRSIGQWLQEYELEIQSAVVTMHELEQPVEAFKLSIVGLYFSLIQGQIEEQTGILLWREARGNADLLDAVKNPHERALAAMRLQNPGEA